MPILSIDAPTLLTIIFVLVDDWYRQSPFSRVLANHPGRQASFSNSEILTLLIAMDYFPYPGEAQFLGFIRANYLELFPRLLDPTLTVFSVRFENELKESSTRFRIRDAIWNDYCARQWKVYVLMLSLKWLLTPSGSCCVSVSALTC